MPVRKIPTDRRYLPKQERSRRKVETILDAATRILVREGYDKASTNRVAKAAGVNIGTLYRYFPNKEALVAALFERHIEQVSEAIVSKSREVEGASLPAAVRALVEGMIKGVSIEPELHQVLVEQVPRAGRPKPGHTLEDCVIRIVCTYLEMYKEELSPRDPELAAFVSVQAVKSLAHAAVLERPEYLRDRCLIDEITDLVVGYLTPDSKALR